MPCGPCPAGEAARLRWRAAGVALLAVAMTETHDITLPLTWTGLKARVLAAGQDGLLLSLTGLGISILAMEIITVCHVMAGLTEERL